MTDPDVPLLADLDAGLLDPARARAVRRAALADPRCAAVLDALAATRADLAAVPAPVAPPERVAGWLAALGTAGPGPARPPAGTARTGPAPGTGTPGGTGPRIDTAPGRPAPGAAADGPAPGSGPDLGTGPAPAARNPAAQNPAARCPAAPDPAAGPVAPHAAVPAGTRPGPRPGRDRPFGAAPGRRPRGPLGAAPARRGRWLLAAAAALVVAALALRPAGPPDLTRVELAVAARSTVGTTDLGALADSARSDRCLAAAGHPGAAVLGGRQVRLDGVAGVLLVLPTGELGRLRVLVVTPDCAVLADDLVGG